MARPKTLTTEEVMNYIRDYMIEYPGTKLKTANIVSYIQSKGNQKFKQHLLRRDEVVKNFIDDTNNKREKNYREIVVYKPIEWDDFFNVNKKHMKKSFQELQSYWSNIANSAAQAFDEVDRIRIKCEKLTNENKELKEQHKKDSDKRERLKQLELENKKLKNIIKTKINPILKEAILQEAGILDGFDNTEEPIITPFDDMNTIRDEIAKEDLEDLKV